mgnify:CR=1 FL=1
MAALDGAAAALGIKPENTKVNVLLLGGGFGRKSKPDYVTGTMAFMFESRAVIRPTEQALAAGHRQRDYQQCWAGLKRHFAQGRA